MANVAPEFGHAETAALLDLADLELIAVPPFAASGIAGKLAELVTQSGRAAKWLHGSSADQADHQLLAKIGGHYFFSHPAIREAREALFANIRATVLHGDPEQLIEDRITASIRRYIDIFTETAIADSASSAPSRMS
jgi:hypothetical protein